MFSSIINKRKEKENLEEKIKQHCEILFSSRLVTGIDMLLIHAILGWEWFLVAVVVWASTPGYPVKQEK